MAFFCYLLLWSGISVMREERLFRCQDRPKSKLKGVPLQMFNMQSCTQRVPYPDGRLNMLLHRHGW